MRLIIRPNKKSDEPQIIKCQSELQDAEFSVDKNRRTGITVAKNYLKFIRKELSGKKGGIFIAQIYDTVAGLIIMYIDKNEFEEKEGLHLYISDLVVLKKFRNQGIGQSLMLYAEKFAKDHNIKEVHLSVLAKNRAALQLYKKKGYKDKKVYLTKKLK